MATAKAPSLPPAAKKAPALPPAAAPVAEAPAARDLGPVFDDVGEPEAAGGDGLPEPEGPTEADKAEGRALMADARLVRFVESVVNNKFEGRADKRPELRKKRIELEHTVADANALPTVKARALAGLRRVDSRIKAFDRMLRPFSPEDRRLCRLFWLNFKMGCRQPNTVDDLITLGFSREEIAESETIDAAAAYDRVKDLQAQHKLS